MKVTRGMLPVREMLRIKSGKIYKSERRNLLLDVR